jgi:hypothetical protein
MQSIYLTLVGETKKGIDRSAIAREDRKVSRDRSRIESSGGRSSNGSTQAAKELANLLQRVTAGEDISYNGGN